MIKLNRQKKQNRKNILLWLALAAIIISSGYGFTANPALAQSKTVPPPKPQPVAVAETIFFSQNSTVSRLPVRLTMQPLTEGTIRYTTNGALPIAASKPYTSPITINSSTVIRAQLFNDNGTPTGNTYTKSYIIANYNQTIPVISLVTDWGHFNTLHNAPQQRGKEWERPVNIEYFTPGGQVQFSVPAGIRIHGNLSRHLNPKKSYRLYFRKEYGGPGNLEYPLFKDSPVTKFDKLVLRSGFQDTFLFRNIPDLKDRSGTAKYFTDQAVRNLHQQMGQPVAHGDWVLLYLNGQFWGLYNLTERIDLQFLRSYSDKEGDWDVIVKESGWDDEGKWYSQEEAKEGDYGAWLENQNWIGSADFTNPGNIGVLEWRVDVENVFSYMFLQAYVQNVDWPSANWVVYRRKDPGAIGNENKWRMMVWDAEDSLGGGADNKVDMNTVQRVHSPHDSITRILEKPFIGNCAFKHRFVNRALEYLGEENKHNKPADQVGQLSKVRVKAEINRQADIIRPFIQLETERWAPDLPGPAIFEQNVQQALNFADKRGDIILRHLDILRYETFTECK